MSNISRYYDMINKALDTFLNRQLAEPTIKTYYSMIKDYTMMGGKRLRPIALILSYLDCGGKDEKKILLPAIAVELHQSYTLILDDIMDEDDFRRGQPGINKKLRDFFLSNFKEEEYKGTLFNKKSSRFTVSTALMLGNICNILSKKAILDSDFDNDVKIKALKVIEDADEKICQGQMLDILMEHKAATEIEYFDMIKNKTAEFFGMCFELGAVFAGADDKRHMYKQVGINSAIAFQIQDDIIDVLGNKGHEFGSDIKKGKKTLLMIKTLEKANDDQKRFIMKIIGKAASDEDIKKVVKIMHDTGAINYCRRLIKQYSEKAKESGILRELVDVMINRDS